MKTFDIGGGGGVDGLRIRNTGCCGSPESCDEYALAVGRLLTREVVVVVIEGEEIRDCRTEGSYDRRSKRIGIASRAGLMEALVRRYNQLALSILAKPA